MIRFSSRDEQDVAGTAAAMVTVFTHDDAIGRAESYTKRFHRDLLQYADKDLRHREAGVRQEIA